MTKLMDKISKELINSNIQPINTGNEETIIQWDSSCRWMT